VTPLREDGVIVEDTRPSYWSQWTQPPTVITVIVAFATVYGSQVIQAERIEALRAQVDAIKQDYQRRDVLAEQLRSIDGRLYVIEQKLGESRSR
jgi:hypothetical protein